MIDFDTDKLPLETQARMHEGFEQNTYQLTIKDIPGGLQDTITYPMNIGPNKPIELQADALGNTYYITLDGNIRYYHNPQASSDWQGDVRIGYSYGATKCPYQEKDLKERTRVPQSITESDFFVNYINTKIGEGCVLIDKTTGNKYKEHNNEEIVGVAYAGSKHWNIKRFLMEPHFNNFNIPTHESINNLRYDLYRYFLFLAGGDREIARNKMEEFYAAEVDPILNSPFTIWINKYASKFGMDEHTFHLLYNVYGSDSDCRMLSTVVEYNRLHPSDSISYQELFDILVAYNVDYRKKNKEDAIYIVTENLKNYK